MSEVEHEHFEKMLRLLMDMVMAGKVHVVIGRGIADEVGCDPVLAQIAPTFWGMTVNAHLDTAQLIASKLFDRQNNAMKVEHLLAMAEEHESIFQHATPEQVRAIVKTARCQIKNLDAALKPIHAKRNRILAHTDPTVISDPAKLEKEVNVTFSDLNQIFFFAGSILNELSRAFRNATEKLEIGGADDYRAVIDLVADARSAELEAYEKERHLPPGSYTRPRSRKGKL